MAQKCNLGCTYCYAQQGTFGGAAAEHAAETALAAVDLLLAARPPGERVNLAFLGGEPLANRPVIRDAPRDAAALGRRARASTVDASRSPPTARC